MIEEKKNSKMHVLALITISSFYAHTKQTTNIKPNSGSEVLPLLYLIFAIDKTVKIIQCYF